MGLSATVLTIMLITLVVLILRVHWNGKQERVWKDYICLRLRVKTIADVVALVYRSKMLEGFERLEKLGEKERRTRIVRMDSRYQLGEGMGRDGVNGLMIDEDEDVNVVGKPCCS